MTCRTRLATVLAGVSECQSIRLPSNDSLSTQWGVSEHVGRRAIQSMDGWVGVRYNKTAGDTICFSVSLFLFHCCPNMGDGKPSGGVPAKLKLSLLALSTLQLEDLSSFSVIYNFAGCRQNWWLQSSQILSNVNEGETGNTVRRFYFDFLQGHIGEGGSIH